MSKKEVLTLRQRLAPAISHNAPPPTTIQVSNISTLGNGVARPLGKEFLAMLAKHSGLAHYIDRLHGPDSTSTLHGWLARGARRRHGGSLCWLAWIRYTSSEGACATPSSRRVFGSAHRKYCGGEGGASEPSPSERAHSKPTNIARPPPRGAFCS